MLHDNLCLQPFGVSVVGASVAVSTDAGWRGVSVHERATVGCCRTLASE